MKIGTITFHRTTNYGALFQTYALQNILDNMGLNNEVIDYRSDVIENRYKKRNPLFFINPKNIARVIIKNSCLRDNHVSFRSFADKHIRTSKKIYTKQNIEEAATEYDGVIVGSDQVWNGNCMGWDDTYFLSFLPDTKKFSYAASFGVDSFSEKEANWYSKQVKGFNYASVREKTGVSLYYQISGEQIPVVLDPTLLTNDFWYNLIDERTVKEKGKFILVYLMTETPTIFEYARKLAKLKGYKVIYINDRFRKISGVVNEFYVSPIQWLTLFSKASFILTNSFHGTAFAINFNIPFWVELLPEPAKVNSRIIDLLDMVTLQNRIICNSSDLLQPISFEACNRIIEERRIESKNYIRSIISRIDSV